ncbi:MAG TPA: hypothetical protein VET24_14285 [Actinomycetota bacterium]|nr:hypothetical protein [Actinomycetota bacterium]
MNSSGNPVQEATSRMTSGRSTLGIRAVTAFFSATKLAGSGVA